MTITARKYALLNRISPRTGHLAGLYLLELSVIISWTLLLSTVADLVSSSWKTLLPVSYLFSAAFLSWLERPDRTHRRSSPLEACGLAEIRLDGFRPSEWQTLRRLLFTPPLVLLLGIGLLPVRKTGRTLLQMISGTRIVPLDSDMDPRSDEEIFRLRKAALMKVISFTFLSLMAASVIIFFPSELTDGRGEGRIGAVHELPERERELMASYLEMKAMYPDCLEFSVRLASLYYRNDMARDLLTELARIRERDPHHAILILGEDLSVDMNDLILERDTAFSEAIEFISAPADTPAEDEPAIEETPAAEEDAAAEEPARAEEEEPLTQTPDTVMHAEPDRVYPDTADAPTAVEDTLPDFLPEPQEEAPEEPYEEADDPPETDAGPGEIPFEGD